MNVRNLKPEVVARFKDQVAREGHSIVAVVEALLLFYAWDPDPGLVNVRRGKKAKPGCQE